MESDFDKGPEFVYPAVECYLSSYSGDKVSRSSEIVAFYVLCFFLLLLFQVNVWHNLVKRAITTFGGHIVPLAAFALERSE